VRIWIYYIGKARDAGANLMADEYVKRTTRWARCEMREIRPDRDNPFTKHPAALKVLLDPEGRKLDTAGFVDYIRRAEDGARDVVFVLGGADGLPPAWRPKADLLLSLSPMTFPHELARAMLAEQIYRAFTTLRGHPYPR